MLKILYAGCPALSPAILSQFTLEVCPGAKMPKSQSNPLFWGFTII